MQHNSFDDQEITEINMTPFVDIVLVILIIFMVTATFVSQGKIPLTLPQAQNTQNQEEKEKTITISLTKDGTFYFDEKLATLADIQLQLQTLKDKNPQIILRSDSQTPFEYVVQIIDTCKKYNLTSFAIQTDKNTN